MRTHRTTRPHPVGRRSPARIAGALLLPLLLLASASLYVLAVRGALSPEAPLPRPVVELLPAGELGAEDGLLPKGRTVTVHEEDLPALTNLEPALLSAVRSAARDAAEDGVTFQVTSGWRSPALQRRLLDDAVETYGSREVAARWVAPPETSSHVRGEAIDLGPVDAASWLSQHGAAHGLCQTYANESWHYELRPEAVTEGCPAPYLDPTEDPRLHP